MHPLVNDLSKLNDEELQKKYNDLVKRLNQVYRLGPAMLIPQIQMVMEDYQSEIQARNRKQMDEMMRRAKESGRDFKDIIDI